MDDNWDPRDYMKKDRNLVPAVETVFRKDIHHAEVRYRDKQYVVKTDFRTREEAMAYAQGMVDDLNARFDEIALATLGKFKLAKE